MSNLILIGCLLVCLSFSSLISLLIIWAARYWPTIWIHGIAVPFRQCYHMLILICRALEIFYHFLKSRTVEKHIFRTVIYHFTYCKTMLCFIQFKQVYWEATMAHKELSVNLLVFPIYPELDTGNQPISLLPIRVIPNNKQWRGIYFHLRVNLKIYYSKGFYV